jgi:23S rRNA maturation mini-RNase III
MTRIEELKSYISVLPDEIQAILFPLLGDIVYEEEVLQNFRDNPRTKTNAAMYKAYRQTKQIYQADIKILLWQFRQNETSAADDLLKKLAEYE